MNEIDDLKNLSKEELIDLIESIEAKFADSLVYASQLVVDLEEKNEALQKMQSKLEGLGKIVDDSFNEIYICSADDFKFRYVNKGALENLGYSMKEMQELTPWDLKQDFTKEEYLAHIQPLLDGSENLIKFEAVHYRKNGSSYPVEVQLQFGTYMGEPICSAIILDRTYEKAMNSKMIESARLASIGELAAGVGHEINNPLAIIMGNTYVLKKVLSAKEFDCEKSQNIIGIIESAGERIRKIVSGLRVFARADENTRMRVLVNDVVREAQDLLGEILRKDGVDLEINIPNKPMEIIASVSRLQQILVNLITNAAHASEGKDERLVALTLDNSDSGMVRLMIEDNGSGIPEEIRHQIFDPFFTTKASGKGTGLGLGITSRIIEELGGNIQLESTVGEGTCFIVTFPPADKFEVITDEISENFEQLPAPNDTFKEEYEITDRVLLVDDEELIRVTVREILEDLGCAVQVADNGADALVILKENHFDTIITDLKMPVMSGFEFLRELKKTEFELEPKIFAITGGVSEEYNLKDQEELRELVDGFLLKPFTCSQILGILKDSETARKTLEDIGEAA